MHYRQNIAKGVQKICNISSEAMWLKLDKHFFGLEKNIYLCAAYMPPQNSSSQSGVVNEDKDDDLRK